MVMTAASLRSGRALFVLPKDTLGGAERIAVTLAEHAAKTHRFEEITIYILSRPDSGALAYFEKYGNVRVIHSGAARELTGILPFAWFVRRQNYEFVFSTHTNINALCCLLRRYGALRTKRHVTRESGWTFDYDWGLLSPVLRGLVRFYGNQDLLICQTRAMAARFNEATDARFFPIVKVAPNPIDCERIENLAREETDLLDHVPRDRIKIVWCGRLVPGKWPERAVQALRDLQRRDRREFHLVIVGDGPMRANLEAEIARTETADRVTLCGHQPNPIKIMARCDYGILTSDIEGFPNVILEMLAAGVRGVVTTDCAGELDEVPGVRVVSSRDPADLACAILQMLQRPAVACGEHLIETRSPETFLKAVLKNFS